MRDDLYQAARAVLRSRGLTAVIVVSLALGTGANAAVYSAIDALLFRGPAGVVQPGGLVDIYTSHMNGGSYGESSYPDFQSIAAADLGLRGIAATEDRGDARVGFDGTERLLRVAAVTDGFWSVIGSPGTVRYDATAVSGAILSHEAWQALGADPAAVGKAVSIDGRAYPIAGIAPPRFRGLHLDRVYDVWVPFDTTVPHDRGDRDLKVVARLGAKDLATLQRGLDTLAAALARAYPETNVGTIRTEDEPRRMTALPYSRIDPSARWRATLLGAILMTATALLLLSACVNAGSLLLSRGMARRHELTIKTALGAARARLIRAFLFESVILAIAGAAGGLLVARWTSASIPALFAPEHAALLDASVRWPVMLATLSAGAFTGLLCGLAPALVATQALPVEQLRGDPSRLGERAGAARLRMSLVAAQLALSSVFLAGGALMARAIDSTLQIDRSAAGGSIGVASVESYDAEYRDRALKAFGAIPWVRLTGVATTPPLHKPIRREFRIRRGATSEIAEIDVNFASRGYFQVTHLDIVEGRFLTRDEETAGDTVIVNEALARRYFADRAVGSELTDITGRTVRIAGVIRTRNYRALAAAERPMVYFPIGLAMARSYCLVVRARGNPPDLEPAMLDALRQAGTPRRLEVASFEAMLAEALAADRMIAKLIAACGALALALAAVGVYGVIGDLVSRRTREIGLRIALGAGPAQILQDVLASSLAPAAAGLVSGGAATVVLTRVGRTFVYELPSADVTTLAAVGLGLALVVIAAIVRPAWRAVRVSPLTALRN
jgi:predicted permease